MERVGELIIDGLVLWAIMVAVWLLIWHGVAWLFRKRVDRVVRGSNWEDAAADRATDRVIPALVTREQMVEDGWRQQDVEYYESLLRAQDRADTKGK